MFQLLIALWNTKKKNHPPTGRLHQLWLKYYGIQIKVPFLPLHGKFHKLQVQE